MVDEIPKKSFNESDLRKYDPIMIESEKKKVNYRYNVSKFIMDAENTYMEDII